MKVTLTAREVAGRYEFDVTADKPMSYDEYKLMFVELTKWMCENAANFRQPTPTPDNKTVTHKIQYRDMQKVMAGISLVSYGNIDAPGSIFLEVLE